MALNQLDRQVAHRLTQYYVLALALVAILMVRGLWFVKSTMRDLTDGGREPQATSGRLAMDGKRICGAQKFAAGCAVQSGADRV